MGVNKSKIKTIKIIKIINRKKKLIQKKIKK